MNNKIPQISTRQFSLYRVTTDDSLHFNTFVNEPAVLEHFMFNKSTIEESEQYLFKAMLNDAYGINFVHRISLKERDGFLGFVRMHRVDEKHIVDTISGVSVNDFYDQIGHYTNIFDIDYAVQNNIRGKGIMREVLPHSLEFLRQKGCDCVIARVNKADNGVSNHLLLNNGFQPIIPLVSSEGVKQLKQRKNLELVNRDLYGFIFRKVM